MKEAAPATARRKRPGADQAERGVCAPRDMSFEDGMKRLEEIVQALEDGTRSLDESLELFEEAMALIRLCTGKLDAAEARVQMLLQESGGDGLRLVDFNEDYAEPGPGSRDDEDEEEHGDEDDDDHVSF